MTEPGAGEWLTRGTVWLALTLYVASEIIPAAKGRPRLAGRWLNTLGCAALLAHVAFAFNFYHHWSHTEAHAETARQTGELFGWYWGGGLYFNYIFALVWLGEVTWTWANPAGFLERPKWITNAIRCFFLFMILNGAVVFPRGLARWFGLALCLLLTGCWWPRRTATSRGQPKST